MGICRWPLRTSSVSVTAFGQNVILVKIMDQSIPAATSPPRADPRASAFFLPWMANSRGWGLLSCQIPRGGDEKRGQMPRPPSRLQHFSLITQSSSAILSILMSDVFVLLRLHTVTTPVYGFSIVIKLLTLKLIVRCKVNCYE